MSGEVNPPSDSISFFEFFQDGFVPEMRLDLPVKRMHRDACNTIEDAFLGLLPPEIQFVIVCIAPRIGKSKILEALGAWAAGNIPDMQAIYTSYGAKLAEARLSYIAETMRRPWYQNLYGDLLHGIRADHLSTTQGGNLYAEGTGGALTGKGAGLKRQAAGFIAIDDPAKPDESLSKVEAESLRKWFENTLKSRRNSDRWCPVILVAQRLGPDDLPGYILRTYPNQTLLVKFPALIDPVTLKASSSDDAISAIPETVSTATLLALRSTRMGRFVLASQYQQEPISLGGNLIQTESFLRFKLADVAGFEWEEMIITCDTALKAKEENDFSCMQLWAKKDNRAYLLDQMHGKWESPQLLLSAITFSDKCRSDFKRFPIRFVIEEKAAGIGLIQQLNVAGVPAEGIERDLDKVRRVQAILPYQEAGLVYIPADNEAPWVAALLAECGEFKPDLTHAHDDMVDCLADGISLTLSQGLSILDVLGKIRS